MLPASFAHGISPSTTRMASSPGLPSLPCMTFSVQLWSDIFTALRTAVPCHHRSTSLLPEISSYIPEKSFSALLPN